MATPNEHSILRIVKDEGSETTVRKIAAKIDQSLVYTRLILRTMKEKGLIGYLDKSGKVSVA